MEHLCSIWYVTIIQYDDFIVPSFSPLKHAVIVRICAGIDVAEQILKRLDGRGRIKKYVLFLVQFAHFQNEMVSKFTYPEIAVAAILKTSDLFQDPVVASIIPAVLHSDRALKGAETLELLASQKGINGFQPTQQSKSPTDVVRASKCTCAGRR
jgi:hypothetical protein